MNARRAGALLALVTLIADQASKFFMLEVVRIGERPPIRVAPFFDLTLVWNRGISFGFFQQHEQAGRWALVALSLAAAAGLSVWLARAQGRILPLALGLLIGGAVGNAIDRALHGSVVDFVLLYWIAFFPYVFNVADAAINVGVGLVLYDSLVLEGRRKRVTAPAGDRIGPGAGL